MLGFADITMLYMIGNRIKEDATLRFDHEALSKVIKVKYFFHQYPCLLYLSFPTNHLKLDGFFFHLSCAIDIVLACIHRFKQS